MDEQNINNNVSNEKNKNENDLSLEMKDKEEANLSFASQEIMKKIVII